MKRLGELLRGARRIEIWIAAAAICALLALSLGDGRDTGSASESEARLERVLSRIEGVGRVTVMLAGEEGVPTGAVVAASGADDVRVALELQRSIRALTGLDLERIEIVKSRN